MKRLKFEQRGDVIFLGIVVGLLLLVIGFQESLSANKLLPIARVNGRLVKVEGSETILRPYRYVEKSELTITADGESYTYKVADLGVTLYADKTLAQYYPESRLKRLIPFSTFAQANRQPIPYYTSNKKSLSIVTNSIAETFRVNAIDAKLTATDAGLTIMPSKNGRSLDPMKSVAVILDAISSRQPVAKLHSLETEPDITTKELSDAVDAILPTVPETINIKAGAQTATIAQKELLGWLQATSHDGKPNITLSADAIDTYSSKLVTSMAYSAPTPTVVALQDGIEVSRIDGLPGKAIDGKDLSQKIQSVFGQKTAEVEVAITDVASPIIYTRTYTKTALGLQQKLQEIVGDRDIGIRYIDINNRGWDVGYQDDQLFQMASTYKMFVAYSTLLRIDSGEFNWTDLTAEDDLSTCLDKMILESDNTCALALAERIGWVTIEDEGMALGATGLQWTDDVYATAADDAALLKHLAEGDILSEQSRTRLIDLMKNQYFRDGIPAGSKYDVADKVGFQDAGLHDAAIVFAPDMKYVLVIFTNDESWEEIANITRQIEAFAQ